MSLKHKTSTGPVVHALLIDSIYQQLAFILWTAYAFRLPFSLQGATGESEPLVNPHLASGSKPLVEPQVAGAEGKKDD
jgi:hypothetical protein